MDISKLVEDGARALALQEHSAKGVAQIWDNDLQPERGNYESAARAAFAIALAAAAEDWIAVAQSGFETWKAKPHNARWFRKIDGTPIPNDLTICIGEAFADRLRTLATQLGAANG